MPDSNNSTPAVPTNITGPVTTQGTNITPQKVQQMVDVLEDLLSHTHVFYDDYGTACNCNCNCNCTRGSL